MKTLLTISNTLAWIPNWAGRIGAWISIPLIVVIMWDVIARRFFGTGSTMLQELEWHFHTVLFMTCIGFAYLRNNHVRIVIVSEGWSARAKLWMELLGCAVVLIPVCMVLIYFGTDLVWRAFEQRERSPNAGGLPYFWIIKSFVPLGMMSLLLAGVAVLGKSLLRLFVPAAIHETDDALSRGHGMNNTRWYMALWCVLLLGITIYFGNRVLGGGDLAVELADALPALMFLLLGPALFCGYPVPFVLGGIALVTSLVGCALNVFPLAQLYNIPARVFGSVGANIVLVAIPMFIFMGVMLEKSGVAKAMLFCFQVLLRRAPGGLAIAVVAIGTIMAATTGIVGASVIMLTLIALPAMLESGYRKELAVGVIAASGTLGILIPPSIMLVLMGDLLAVPVGVLFLAAIFPGLTLSLLYLIYVMVRCTRHPEDAPPMASDMGPRNVREYFIMLVRGFWPPVFLIVLVLGSILFGFATPTEASGVGALGAILLAAFNRKLNFVMLRQVIEDTALTNAMLFAIFIGATFFSYVFRSLGGDHMIVSAFQRFGLGPWGFLMAVMTLVFILGFFFEWIEITLIVLPIFAPIFGLLDFGAHVLKPEVLAWFAILVAINLQTSYLTPPFGITLFYMKAIVPPDVKMQHIIRGIAPFVILQVIGLVLCIIFPEIALWLPRKLLD